MKYSIKNYIYNPIFLIFILQLLCCKKINKNFKSFTDDEEITTITSDNETELIEAIKILNDNGGTIYIDTPVISLIENSIIIITGQFPGGIIGVRQSNGEYPRIDFSNRMDYISGINIFGANKFLEYIIIENSPKIGITIFSDNNILDHVISRYNYGSGFHISGDFNTLNYCYSYRNFGSNDMYLGSSGFLIAGEINNVLNYCFAWDNAYSGFSYNRILNSSELSYLHSGSWNNGNINVFTGKYDYDNGKPLDKNLWTIKDIMSTDPNFVSNYYNKKYNIDDASIDGYNVNEWIARNSPKLDGNGFTFGNLNSSQSIDVKKNALYCIAFDHKSVGFVDNYNHKYNGYFTNCVSFNNGINYKLPFTFSKWINNWSWGSKNKDQFNQDIITKIPSNSNTAQRSIYSVRDQIVKAVFANMFPDGINFDNVIINLKEKNN